MFSRGPVSQYEVSINFLTKDNLNKENDGDHYEAKYKDIWEAIKVGRLIKLTEIKDFEELEFN